MRLPTEKEIQKLLEHTTVTAAKAPPSLDVRGSGDFRLGEWITKIKKAFSQANPIQRFHYIRVTDEQFELLKAQCNKPRDPRDAPWQDTFYGIPVVVKDSKQDAVYKAQGWKGFDIYG